MNGRDAGGRFTKGNPGGPGGKRGGGYKQRLGQAINLFLDVVEANPEHAQKALAEEYKNDPLGFLDRRVIPFAKIIAGREISIDGSLAHELNGDLTAAFRRIAGLPDSERRELAAKRLGRSTEGGNGGGNGGAS